jgi:hypothetical protein
MPNIDIGIIRNLTDTLYLGVDAHISLSGISLSNAQAMMSNIATPVLTQPTNAYNTIISRGGFIIQAFIGKDLYTSNNNTFSFNLGIDARYYDFSPTTYTNGAISYALVSSNTYLQPNNGEKVSQFFGVGLWAGGAVKTTFGSKQQHVLISQVKLGVNGIGVALYGGFAIIPAVKMEYKYLISEKYKTYFRLYGETEAPIVFYYKDAVQSMLTTDFTRITLGAGFAISM